MSVLPALADVRHTVTAITPRVGERVKSRDGHRVRRAGSMIDPALESMTA